MKNEQDLFNEIEDVLHAHQDAYVPGAWEEFVKNKRRRRGLVYIRIVAAAAILLMLGYTAWLFVPANKVDNTANQTKTKIKKPYIYSNRQNERRDSVIIESTVASLRDVDNNLNTGKAYYTPNQSYGLNNSTNGRSDIQRYAQNVPPIAPNDIRITGKSNNFQTVTGEISVHQDSLEIATLPFVRNADDPIVAKTESKRYDRGTQRLNYDSLANLSKLKPVVATEKKARNLSYAVLLSPSVGNQKMNFGTGVEVAYDINKSFSVSSGISYSYVNAGSNRSPLSADATPNYSLQGYTPLASANTLSYSTSAPSQNVQGVKLALSGLEIPLNFQFKTAKGFYLSAGISAMSVIGNNLSYNYISNRAVSVPSANGLTNTISIITEQTTQKSNENLSGYIGFYTLSAGKKISFGRGKLNFAPFIKVPFNRVSSENIQLIHGGVQLGIGF